jgi:hypothetical protein
MPATSSALNEKIKYALSYYLENILPKGGTACVLYPKKILTEILPEAASAKKCKIICLNGPPGLISKLTKTGLLQKEMAEADIYITEPEGFTRGGALVHSTETQALKQHNLVGIGSIYNWTQTTPAAHDTIQLERVITEKGIYTSEHFELNAFSSQALSTPSPSSQSLPSNP